MSKLEIEYRERYETVLKPLAVEIESQLREYFENQPRVDRITARAKSIDRFLAKASKADDGKPKYSDPLAQIQDQVGARIITFYRSDVEPATDLVKKYFRLIETKDLLPESEWEFGYFGRHFVALTPTELIGDFGNRDQVPKFFEIQIKTLFQHAWSEANHDLGYKAASGSLPPDAKRRLAFTSAQAWGADHIFDELFEEFGDHSPTPSST